MTIRYVAAAVFLLMSGWIAVLAGVAMLSDRAPAALVMFPSEGFFARLPADAAIVSATSMSVTLAANTPDFVRTLYQSGAWLVLPAGLSGCGPSPQQEG